MNAILGARLDGVDCTAMPVDDRGLNYGDGVFRTMLVIAGTVIDLPGQIDHIVGDAAALGIRAPDPEWLAQQGGELARDLDCAVLKIMITRGAGQRGYALSANSAPRTLMLVTPAPRYPARLWHDGISLQSCSLRLAIQPRLAGIKHLNRLEQVLASAELDQADEGLLADHQDRAVGGIRSNLFWSEGECLHTPLIVGCGVAGRTRARIIELARQLEIRVQEQQRPLNWIRERASEVFVSNSLIGIWPVREWDGAAVAGGPLAEKLLRALDHPWRQLCAE